MRGVKGGRWRVGFSLLACGLLFVGNLGPPVAVAGSAPSDDRAVPACFGRAPTVVGTEGDDTLTGTAVMDVIVGLGGDDTIRGGGGGDYLCGNGGGDRIFGAGGNDSIAGGSGPDVLLGGVGRDRIWGGAGDDRLKGWSGDDTLNGGGGSDVTIGGPDTDTCAGAENLTGCEVVPPSGCSNPALVPATPVTTNVTVTGSNAYQYTDSVWIIEGTTQRLAVRVEVRNDTAESIDLGSAEIAVYDAGGTRIGKRFADPFADVLAPGKRTVLTEAWPSMSYWSYEWNHFPEGWASWEVIIGSTPGEPGSFDDVILGSRLQSLTWSSGQVTYQLAAVNTIDRPINYLAVWVVLLDSRGALLNILRDSSNPEGGLAPGAELLYEDTYSGSGPTCFASARWGAAGQSWTP